VGRGHAQQCEAGHGTDQSFDLHDHSNLGVFEQHSFNRDAMMTVRLIALPKKGTQKGLSSVA
jgi:hypothetical protein